MGRGYTIFDTAVGRCGIVWSDAGIVAVHLPEAREIETRRRLFQIFPDTRELHPPPEIQGAIDGIAALLRGKAADFSADAVLRRWQAGESDVATSLAHPLWLAPPPRRLGVVVHELRGGVAAPRR